jgi:hypothetical protein
VTVGTGRDGNVAVPPEVAGRLKAALAARAA